MIVMLETIHEDARALLAGADDLVLADDPRNPESELTQGEVRAIVTRGLGQVTADTIASLPALEVVARCGAGLDNIDTAAARRSGVKVVHTPGSTTFAVAEHGVLLMLALARQLNSLSDAVRNGDWAARDGYQGIELRGKRLGVVGLGAIGTRIGEIGRSLDMDVVSWTQRDHGLAFPKVELDELFATADVMQVCVAATPETQQLVGRRQFDRMKPDALLINTARGSIVDHVALADALAVNGLGGYAADVWAPEPPEVGDRLLLDPRVLVTPHVAAFTDVTYREICVRAARAVAAILADEQPEPACIFAGHA